MSHAPCTLFWPRSGLTPVPGRPIWPVSSARLATARTCSVPDECWVIPIEYTIAARGADA